MEELVKYIAGSLVDKPEEIATRSFDEDGALVVELKVAVSDMGKVIGKQGRIAKALRTVVKSAAARHDRTVLVDIVE